MKFAIAAAVIASAVLTEARLSMQSVGTKTPKSSKDLSLSMQSVGTKTPKSSKRSKGKSGKCGKSGKVFNSQCDDADYSSVYTMTNQPMNEVLVYSRNTCDGSILSGSNGDGINLPRPVDDPLASTGSIITADDCLLAVNAGSDDISTFRILSPAEIQLVARYHSDGNFPVSLAEREGLVYVLNAGGNGSMQGFHLTPETCELTPIEQDPIVLNQGNVAPSDPAFFPASPAQIGFTPEGNIVVTIKVNGGGQNFPSGEGSLNVYSINPENGTTTNEFLTQTNVNGTAGSLVPFSFDFDDKGNLLLVEAFGAGGPVENAGENAGAVRVYADIDGIAVNVTADITNQTTSCWIVYNPKNSCVYTTNNGGSSISALSWKDDELELIDAVAATLNNPLDMVLSPDYKYLYALASGHTDVDQPGQPRIHVYENQCDCSLVEVQNITDGLPPEDERGRQVNGVVGLALW
eukprot:scaffold10670_cov103-Skeletonema_dohrnii-CCMP3373.AAC.5